MTIRKRIGLTRRGVLSGGVLTLLPLARVATAAAVKREDAELKIGLVTDLHYADKPAAGTRHYRETLDKLDEAATLFEQRGIDLVVELGDLIDAAPSVDTELQYLSAVNAVFSGISKDRHYVAGNHCVDTLTKDEFLGAVEQQRFSYSFERGNTHFVILDSCFRSDGAPYGRRNFDWTDANIPLQQLEWLETDLRETEKPVVVFAHQRLDVSNNHGVRNNADVRSVLEASGNVRAVFQGHSHRNDLRQINGIAYCTLVAMVEGSGASRNGYCVLEIFSDGTMQLDGFREQRDYESEEFA